MGSFPAGRRKVAEARQDIDPASLAPLPHCWPSSDSENPNEGDMGAREVWERGRYGSDEHSETR